MEHRTITPRKLEIQKWLRETFPIRFHSAHVVEKVGKGTQFPSVRIVLEVIDDLKWMRLLEIRGGNFYHWLNRSEPDGMTEADQWFWNVTCGRPFSIKDTCLQHLIDSPDCPFKTRRSAIAYASWRTRSNNPMFVRISRGHYDWLVNQPINSS